jgi:hypothetical protein
MAKKSGKKKSTNSAPANIITKLATVEAQMVFLETQMEKLEKAVYEIKDNHLAHIALSLNEIQFTLNKVKTCDDSIREIETKLLKQDMSLQAVKDVRKMMIALAVILVPYGLAMGVTTLKSIGILH